MPLKNDEFALRVDHTLDEILSQQDIPAIRIKEAIEYSLFSGGKRFRPKLVYLTGELLNISLTCLDYIAAAIELIHCYSLIHDDLPAMDNDDTRRGKPTTHIKFDEATAILAGDGMQALAVEVLINNLSNQLPANNILNITQTLVKASGVSGMVSGQCLDLSELSKKDLNLNSLERIHRLKTGCLISASIKMVIQAQADNSGDKHSLEEFANILGLVFQMQDDYLDRYAFTDTLGKGRCSDLANDKTTYASFYSQEELKMVIINQFKKAEECLKPFGNKARALNKLVQNLKSRSH